MLTLYDAARCPFCARVRIALAEKGIPYDPVEIDLDDRPAWMLELNPPNGRVPVIEEGTFVLPESPVIMEFLEERFPEPALLPADAAERAVARLLVFRFDEALGGPYYDLFRERPSGSRERLEASLGALDRRLEKHPYLAGPSYSIADIAYVPWVLRSETRLGLDLAPFVWLSSWLEQLLERPAVAAEREVVLAL